MSKLLLDENPLLVMPALAVKIGLNESIFVQQLHYWLGKSVNVKEDHRWVYNTAKEWQEQFPFWSISTIRRIVRNLEKDGLIVTGNFNALPIDKTLWYRIDYDVMSSFEDESLKSKSSGQSGHSKCSERTIEVVNLNTPLPEITTEITTEITNNNDNVREQQKIETPFSFYQENGFGILTPHIGEKVGAWIDDTNAELVTHALKIAVENSVPRWSYAESILKDWSNKKITSVEQVMANEAKRQKAMSMAKRSYGRQTTKEEVAPAWFAERDTQQSKLDKPINNKESQFDLDAERKKLLEELKGPVERGDS